MFFSCSPVYHHKRRSAFLRQAASWPPPAQGTQGAGKPDIANATLQLIWEVKSGGVGGFRGVGGRFPTDRTIALGFNSAQWYAPRASILYGTQWNAGDPYTDPALTVYFNANCGGITGTCNVQFPSGPLLAIQLPQMARGMPISGVITYQVNQQINNPWPVVTVLAYTLAQLFSARFARLWSFANGGEDDIFSPALAYANNPGDSGYNSGSGDGGGSYGPHGNCSFTPDTIVATPDGYEPIGQLEVGNQVLAYNPLTRMMEAQPILHVWKHDDSDLVNVTLAIISQTQMQTDASELIHTTSRHPFLTQEAGFVVVGKLHIGMHVLQADGRIGMIVRIQVVSGTMEMYNLEVKQDHTFAVGYGEWIVHNECIL